MNFFEQNKKVPSNRFYHLQNLLSKIQVFLKKACMVKNP